MIRSMKFLIAYINVHPEHHHHGSCGELVMVIACVTIEGNSIYTEEAQNTS